MKQFLKTPLLGVYVFLAATLVLIVANAWFMRSTFQTVVNQEAWVMHTSNVLTELERLMSSVKKAESSQRGFLLTNESSFLVPYRAAQDEAQAHLVQLKVLIRDNPKQEEYLAEIERITQARLARLDDHITDPSITALARKERLLEGQTVMDSLRALLETMKTEENKLLGRRSLDAAESRKHFWWTLTGSTLLLTFVIFFFFIQVRNSQLRAIFEAEKDARESWLQTKVAEVASLTTGDHSLSATGSLVLNHLASEFSFLVGNLYIAQGDRLRRVASHGLIATQDEVVPKTVRIGESLIGQAFKKPGVLEISDIPENYLFISSSLGEAPPRHLVLVPVRFQNRPIGVIELASFKPLNADVKEALDRLLEPIGIGINAAVSREELQSLLEKTQQQAEELQAQQEELRTSNEELEQQARALESQQQSLNLKNNELESARAEMETKAQELHKTNLYKSEFLAKMSHELRTPLNSLLILASLLIENKERNLTEQQREFARSIHGAGEDLLGLINDILDLSKIEARKLSLRPEPFFVHSLIDQVKNTFTPLTDSKGLSLELSLSESLKEQKLYTDRQRLEQILRNFLSNAVKFTDSGTVRLSVEETPQGLLRFLVQDTGVGIPPEKQKLIFDAFEQADGSVSRKYGGTGLGLTISRELAALLGGTIALESSSDQGSCFSLTIPKELPAQPHQSQPASSESPSTPEPTLSNASFVEKEPELREPDPATLAALKDLQPTDKSILIVEDDDVFRASVADASKAYGFKPIETHDGETALALLQRHTPSAILLDIKLPGLSGLGLLEMIKQMPHLRHVPIHMISALEYQQNALRMGAMGYLGKPVTIDKIRSALSRIENLVSRKVRRLLIIEDDDRQRDAIKKLVFGQDIEIETANTGKESLEKIKSMGFDCIILDLSLPDISGFDLLDHLNSMDVSLPPIVIYTGKELSRKEEEYLRRYSESIIIKGAKSPERLLDEVNLFLHRVETLLPAEKQKMLTDLRSQDQALEGKRVLVVDDDLRNVFALTSVLEGRGLQVKIARDGFEALEALEKDSSFDVVLMDIMMPRMDGYETMRRIRQNQKFKELPIVALTAKAMKEDHEKCIAAGANDYLQKPINISNLLSVLKVWLAPKGIFS